MPTIETLESRIAPATIYALDNIGNLLVFDSESPGSIQTMAVTGLIGGQTLRGIDFRPATGELYGVAATTGAASNSVAFTYIIDPRTAAAVLVGQTAAALAGWADLPSGFDFNPMVDRMRLVNTNDENFRLVPVNGALAGNDTDLTPGAAADVIAEAYDRNFTGGTVSTLFAINRVTSSLAIQGGLNGSPSPNGGVITNIGSLGFTLSGITDGGFDIASDTGIAYAALTAAADGLTRLYTIDLATGAATAVGVIGLGFVPMRGLAVALPGVTIVNDHTAKYTDTDGDRVTIKVSEGTLAKNNFLLGAAAGGRGSLTGIALSGIAFDDANLSITVTKSGGGDGLAHVGFLAALGVDLGKVSIKGDLGRILAGDGDAATPGLEALTVRSLGTFGLVTQGGRGSVSSSIVGALGSLKVGDDFGNAILTAGTFGRVSIGDDFLGQIFTAGDIASFRVGGDIIGIEAFRGYVNCTHLGPVVVGGSIVGGAGALSGLLQAQSMDTVHIRGDLVAGSDFATGGVSAFATSPGLRSRIESVRIDGSVIGGNGPISAYIHSQPFGVSHGIGKILIGGDLIGGAGGSSGQIQSEGTVGSVTIRGSIVGNGGFSGVVSITGDLGKLTVGEDILGSNASTSGCVVITGNMGPVKVGGDLVGGSVTDTLSVSDTGAIIANNIASVQMKGSVISGSDLGAGTLSRSGTIIARSALGPVTIGGDIIGNFTNPVNIVARSQNTVVGETNLALASISVKGDVEFARIFAGFSEFLAPVNADASIGKIAVNGAWRASSAVAGAQDGGTPGFGSGDTLQPGGMPGVIARISSITIKGSVTGTLGAADHFGFVAEEVGSVKISGRKVPLNSDVLFKDNVLVPFTDDVRILEVI